MEETKNDFENAYSRQIGAYGMEMMGKLIQMEVLIIGLRGLGIETAKNVVLAGPKKVHIWDNEVAKVNDMGSNFFIQEDDINKKRRDIACVDKLKELNPRCDVDVLSFNPFEFPEKCIGFNVIALTEIKNTKEVEMLDEIMRQNKGAFIYAASLGVSGFVFSDFGPEFSIRDNNGEECKKHIVKDISSSENGVVMIDDNLGRLSYEDGDYVVFKEVKGMEDVNDGLPRQIKYISPFAFSIGNTLKYGKYITGGIVEQVKVPKIYNYRSFKDSYETPYLKSDPVPDPTDFSKFGRNELLHVAIQTLHKYYNTNGSLPKQNDYESVKALIEETKTNFNINKESIHWLTNSQQFDDEIVKKVLLWAASSIVPTTSFMGGIVAQEIIKFTGKFTPINQWLWFDFFESTVNIPETSNKEPMNCRFDDQICIIGRELQEKLKDLNIFMIGAGALGCEFLKEFALMGISCGKGLTTVTDNDHIEISNLNRQFLFRINDVRKPKSQIAAKAAKVFNSNYNVKDLQTLVTPENEHIFNDEFWEKQDFVINAVDNIKARKYIDSKCTWYTKPLIDSGTLGTKAHSQMIFPHVTNCYNDKTDPVEDSVPMCTLHNFPSMIEHCIEYGRDAFTGNFCESLLDLQKYLKNCDSYVSDLRKETQNTTVQITKLESVKALLEIKKSNSFESCVTLAFNSFISLFDHRIRQLLYNFPADFKNNDGSLFWVGSKRVPSPITYNVNDELCLIYVASYSILVAQSLGIQPKDYNFIKSFSSSLKIQEFVPQKIKIKVNENDDDGFDGSDEEGKVKQLISELCVSNVLKANPDDVHPQEFEKDDDTNHHIDFIHACANLRARNYTISESDRLKTKLIAGKIVPAIATTTASITGLVALQIITGLTTNKIDYLRDGYINLGVNIYLMTEPGPKIKMQDKEYDQILLGPVKAIPSGFSIWDKIVVDGSMTVSELIDYYMDKFECEATIIAAKGITIYMSFTPSHKERLGKKIEVLFEELSKQKISENYLVLEVSCDTLDGACALMPPTKYKFK